MLALGGYLVLGGYTILRWNLVMGDALSRLAGANYVIASRDQHLTAIGFVWNPLPSLTMVPVLTLRPLWEALGQPGFAATIVSATAMAFAVACFHRLVARWGLGRGARLVAVLAFAANPMVALYATNGMSEAFVLALLIPAVGAIAQWLDDPDDTAALVRCSVLLGLAYLVRYEPLAATGGVAAVAAFVAWRRSSVQERIPAAVGNVIVVLAPSFFAFVVFALSSWLITGSLAEQFTSAYGNTAVIASDSTLTLSTGLRFSLTCLAVLAPLVGVLVAGLFVRGDARGLRRLTAVAAVLGAVLVIAAGLQAIGSTLHFLRFFIVAVPAQILLACTLVAPANRRLPARSAGGSTRRPGRGSGAYRPSWCSSSSAPSAGRPPRSACSTPTSGCRSIRSRRCSTRPAIRRRSGQSCARSRPSRRWQSSSTGCTSPRARSSSTCSSASRSCSRATIPTSS